MICGSPIEYFDKAQPLTCTYCGKSDNGHIRCSQGHYLCEACHNMEAMKFIENISFNTKLKDPVAIAKLMMSHSRLSMLGCQHAYIAAGSFLAAIKNGNLSKMTNEDIQEAFKRIQRQAIGGYCGLTGVCGIVPAIGACFSILLGSRCGKDIEQKMTMEVVTRVSKGITDLTGPSCCKAYVWRSLAVATEFLNESLDTSLPSDDLSIECLYSNRHPHGCRKNKCPYYKKNKKYRKQMRK